VGAPGSSIGEGAADDIGVAGKQSRRTGPPERLAMPGSRVKGGGAPAMDFGNLTAYYAKSSGF
jgi:hypothetical protein